VIQTIRHPPAADKMRILIIASTYPRHEKDDYAVPWLRESVKRLASRGHQVTILAPSYEGLRDHYIDNVPVHRFRYSPRRWEHLTHEQGAPNRIRNPLYQVLGLPYVLMGWRAAVRLARQEAFDVVHVHWPFPHGPLGYAAARVCGAALVMTSHGAEFALARRKPWIRPILRHTLHTADLLLANSSWTAREINDLSGLDAVVLPFGATVDGAKADAATHRLPQILFTGRLIQRKGVEYLLRAVPRILAQHPAEILITGDGDQRAKLEQLTDSLGLRNTVHFLGFLNREQLDAVYASCDVWVNPAIIDDKGDTEGLGVGAIEAFAHRKTVVASAVGGIPDVVKNGVNGFLVPEKDERRLAEAILELLDHPARAAEMAEAGLRFAREAFDWDHITQQLEDMYRQLIAQRASRESLVAEAEALSALAARPAPNLVLAGRDEPCDGTASRGAE
jgi:glycosyltransferase involved in cell wall biosynthesis